jgi:WD40 repeat protein
MPTDFDRRKFLRAAGHMTLGTVAFWPGVTSAKSPPPPPPKGTPLKVIEGDGVLPLPAGATTRLGDPRLRVPGDVNAVQFSPRGTTLVAASGSELRAWDPRTGRILFRVKYPERASVNSGRLTSADTFALLVQPEVGDKFEIRQYAFGTGKSVTESPSLTLGHPQHTAFSLDGTLVAIVRTDRLDLYDAKGVEKWHETLPPNAIGGCRFFPDGSTIAVSVKGAVNLYSAATGKVGNTLKVADVGSELVGPDRGPDWVAESVISADGKWLAAAVGEDGDLVYCWDVKPAKVRYKLKAAKPIGFTPDGTELFTLKDAAVTIWKLSTGAAARTFDVPNDEDLALSPDGKTLAAAAGDSVILIDAATGKHQPHSSDPPGRPDALRFDSNGHLFGLLTTWGGWADWDLRTGKAKLIRPATVGGLTPLSLSADCRTALYWRKDEYEIREIESGKSLISERIKVREVGSDAKVAMTPDGLSLVIPAPEGLSIVAAVSRTPLTRPGEAPGPASRIAISGDGRFTAAAHSQNEERGAIDVYDLRAGKYLRSLATEAEVSRIDFAPDGSTLVAAQDGSRRNRSGDDERAIQVYDVTSGRVLLRLTHGNYQEPVLALSSGGRFLAHVETSSDEKTAIAVWDVLGNTVRARFPVGSDAAALAFAPDGRTLAASVSGAPVFLWDLYARNPVSLWSVASHPFLAWNDLRAPDGAVAHEAVKVFAGWPAAAVPFLRERVAPVEPPNAEMVKRLTGDLDHKDYRRREVAMRTLAELGERAREPLNQCLRTGHSPEVRERIERILAAQERPTPEQLRRLRSIEAMEVAGTREAADLLAHWASGAPGAHFTREAAAAAKRLAAR